MARPPRLHNLGHNRSEHTPARWLFFDTETLPLFEGRCEVHTFALGVAELVERRGPSRRTARPSYWTMTEPAQLADAVEDACRPGEALWVCAHNLAFDLTVTRLPVLLAERGWRLGDHAMTSAAPWFRMGRRRSRLTVVDSSSWLPGPEAQLGADVGIAKRALPAWDAPKREWWERCAGDVEILRAAMCELLDWWDRCRLGHWSLTGPGTGFNSYRHRLHGAPVVIEPDRRVNDLERAAVYGGRVEAARLGDIGPGSFAELDFAHAFASVMAGCALPRRRVREFDRLAVDERRVCTGATGVIAEVEVETVVPRYPLRTRRGIVHPVGRFTTLLAGPEIAAARRRGELRAIGPGVLYALSSHMAGWADWAVGIVDGRDPGAPMVARRAVKAWTRSVPGRWAGRTSRVALELEQPVPGWRVEMSRHGPGGVPGSILDMSGRRQWLVQDVDMDDCFPAVLAWIQSVVRDRLGRVLEELGEAAVLWNTDGVMVQASRSGQFPDPRGADLRPLELRCKARHGRLRVLSPLHWVSDQERQLSGVPRSAGDLGGDRYVFTDWPRLTTQLQEPDERGYRRTQHVVDLADVPTLRWVLEDGRTVPVAARGSLEEPTRLEPWSLTPRPAGAVLRTSQHPLLRALVD